MRRTGGRSAVPAAGAALTLVGLALWLLSILLSRSEPHSWSATERPPATVRLTQGDTYSLGVPGGLDSIRSLTDTTSLRCTATAPSGAVSTLSVTAETNTKALHRIATFVSPVSGEVAVACPAIGDVYVDDADGAHDYAGVLRLLATLVLVVGVPLAISGLAAAARARPPRPRPAVGAVVPGAGPAPAAPDDPSTGSPVA